MDAIPNSRCLGCRMGLPLTQSSWDLSTFVHHDGSEVIRCTHDEGPIEEAKRVVVAKRGKVQVKLAFLAELRKNGGSLMKAYEVITRETGTNRITIGRWRKKDEKFNAAIVRLIKGKSK